MAQPRKGGQFAKKAPADPADALNKKILREIKQRAVEKEASNTLAQDLGLDFKEPDTTSTADNPADFLADEWDRKAFGDPVPTYTRIIYGPDPLLTTCPQMKASIEAIGLEAYADATYNTIMTQGEHAVPDPIMRKGLRGAFAKFDRSRVAEVFRERILKIPQRTVEVEADRSDALIFSKPMEEAVMRYGHTGMAPKFLSERCIGVLGLRGYEIVKDEKGDVVKVGTLIMGEIPLRMAERRREHFAALSEQTVRESAEAFEDNANRAIHEERTAGVSVLHEGDSIYAGATESEASAGTSRSTGFRVERQK